MKYELFVILFFAIGTRARQIPRTQIMKWLRFSAPVATPNKKKTCLFLLSTLLGLFGLIWSNDRRLRRFRPRLHPIDTTDRIVVLMYTDYWCVDFQKSLKCNQGLSLSFFFVLGTTLTNGTDSNRPTACFPKTSLPRLTQPLQTGASSHKTAVMLKKPGFYCSTRMTFEGLISQLCESRTSPGCTIQWSHGQMSSHGTKTSSLVMR